jgi:lysophospholipase L1-like esterase
MKHLKKYTLRIYCFGDSHSMFFNNFDFCEAVYLGPQLAYTLLNRVDTIAEILKERDLNNEVKKKWVLFCFGEIDVRVHLFKRGNVKECADLYIDAVEKIRNRGYQCVVFGTVGSSMIEQRDEYPTVGTCAERNRIAREFNKYVKMYCGIEKISYFDVLDTLVDEDGLTNEEYYDSDKVHLGKKAVSVVRPLLFKAIGE